MTILPSKRLRIFKTCNLYMSAAVSGMSMAVAGPAMLDLQHVVKTDTEHIAAIYTGRSFGYLFGSLIGGVLLDMTAKKQFLMTIPNFFVAVSVFAMSFSGSIEILTAWMVLNGLSMGSLDIGLVVCCLNLWGKGNGPFLQGLNFSCSVGYLIAPLAAAPFVGHYISTEEQTWNSTIDFINQSALADLDGSLINSSFTSCPTIPPIFYGFAIIGSIAFLVTILFFVVGVIAPLDEMGQKHSYEEIRKVDSMFVVTVTFLGFLLLFAVTGVEIGYAQVVATYAVIGPLGLSPAAGSYVTSTFWGAFTLSRFAAIFLTMRFGNESLILFDLLVTSTGAVVLLVLAATREWALWLASFLLGLGIAPLFATAIAWVEQYIQLTNKLVAILTTGAAFGEMVIPYAITYFIVAAPQVLSYVVTATCVLSGVLVLFLYLLLKDKQDKYQEKEGISNAAYDVTLDAKDVT